MTHSGVPPRSPYVPDPLHLLHPLIAAAARGELPNWAEVAERRRRHLASVAELISQWAEQLGLDECDRQRWVGAAWLHDALRDADAHSLTGEAGEYPPRLRHGPAVAARLAAEGVNDQEILDAIRYHTTGRRGLQPLGRFLYLADYLDPRRKSDAAERSALRARLPQEQRAVLKIVCAQRISYMLSRRVALMPDTVGFLNELVAEE